MSSPRSSPRVPTPGSPTSNNFLYIYEQPAKEMWKIVYEELEFNIEDDQVGEGASAKVYKVKIIFGANNTNRVNIGDNKLLLKYLEILQIFTSLRRSLLFSVPLEVPI
jgi:hypothetical protein